MIGKSDEVWIEADVDLNQKIKRLHKASPEESKYLEAQGSQFDLKIHYLQTSF